MCGFFFQFLGLSGSKSLSHRISLFFFFGVSEFCMRVSDIKRKICSQRVYFLYLAQSKFSILAALEFGRSWLSSRGTSVKHRDQVLTSGVWAQYKYCKNAFITRTYCVFAGDTIGHK